MNRSCTEASVHPVFRPMPVAQENAIFVSLYAHGVPKRVHLTSSDCAHGCLQSLFELLLGNHLLCEVGRWSEYAPGQKTFVIPWEEGGRVAFDRKTDTRGTLTARLLYDVAQRVRAECHARLDLRWTQVMLRLVFDHGRSCIVWNGELLLVAPKESDIGKH